MINKLIIGIVLFSFLILSSCQQDTVINNSSSPVVTHYDKSQIDDNGNPRFYKKDEYRTILTKMTISKHELSLRSRKHYLFVQNGSYVLRYDIINNTIDSIVYLGKTADGFAYRTTFSLDGCLMISYMYNAVDNYSNDSVRLNYYLTDFESHSSKLLAKSYSASEVERCQALIPEHEKNDYYDLEFAEDILKNELLSKSMFLTEVSSSFDNALFVAIDALRAGLFVPGHQNAERIKDYRFIVLNLQSDDILQMFEISVYE